MVDNADPRKIERSRLYQEPELMIWQTRQDSLSIPAEEVAAIQIAGLRKRFADLRSRLPVLDNLAREQGIDEITDLNAAAPLLFKHSVYKSYPFSLIEKNRFDRLTEWLGSLTTIDLSVVRTEGLQSVDDWIDALLRDVGIRISHSTGTSGKMSFLPRGPDEVGPQLRAFRLGLENDVEVERLDELTLIAPQHRRMFNGYGACVDAVVDKVYEGDESRLLTLYPGRMSADVLTLGGRLMAAEDRGATAEISPALLARRAEFVEQQRDAPAAREAFYNRIFTDFADASVMFSANWIMLHDLMDIGLAQGVKKVFSPRSRISIAGGTKGRTLPEGYQDRIRAFLGGAQFVEGYGMSELSSLMLKCEEGHYHAVPWIICYLIDPDTGEAAPRTGTHTGRFGAIDLLPTTRWGGVLTGDEVTMCFDACACGRAGPTIKEGIRRYSEKQGGDDKITCAGAPEAHDRALAFLAEMD